MRSLTFKLVLGNLSYQARPAGHPGEMGVGTLVLTVQPLDSLRKRDTEAASTLSGGAEGKRPSSGCWLSQEEMSFMFIFY